LKIYKKQLNSGIKILKNSTKN